MALSVTLMGVDITNKVNFETVKITDTQEHAGDTLVVQMYGFDQDVFPIVGNEVIILDGSTKEFAGIILSVSKEIAESNRLVIYTCSAVDYTAMLDRRYLNKVYASKVVANGAGDSIIEDIFYDLKTAAEGDDATGIGDTFYNDFYSNLSSTYVVANGPNVRQQVFNRILPSQALSTLAESTGHIWWIDFDRRINFRNLDGLVADHLPLRDSKRTLHVEESFDYWDLTIEDTMQGLGTKAIIKDAVVSSLAPAEERHQVTAYEGTHGFKFHLSKRPFSQFDITSVQRIRSSVTTTFAQQMDDIDRDFNDETTPSAQTCFLYVGRQGQNDSYVRFTNDFIQTSDEIVITYKYATNDDHENIDTQAVAKAATATGGDGYHEFVFSQGSEIVVTGLAEIDEVAQILLDRKSKILKRGEFTTHQKGWQAGQTFNIRWDRENINEEVWVININKTILTPANDPSLTDNVIETSVQFSNIPRGMRL